MLRKPAVAGMFYPDDSEELVKTIEDCFLHSFGPGKIPDIESFEGNDYPVNVMVPHAGFQYSGTIAAHSYCELAKNGFPEVFIIIGPNHTGLGSEVSVFNKGEWITPLGNIQVDEEFADTLKTMHDLAMILRKEKISRASQVLGMDWRRSGFDRSPHLVGIEQFLFHPEGG